MSGAGRDSLHQEALTAEQQLASRTASGARSALDVLIDRLEIRRMETSQYKARWCLSCLRTELREPFVMLHSGDGGACHQQMRIGSVSECIADFRSALSKAEPTS